MRDPGFYWVLNEGGPEEPFWIVAEWWDGHWFSPGVEDPERDANFVKIDERRIIRPEV